MSEPPERWRLRLYVAGWSPAAKLALENINEICERHVVENYSIEIVDLYENPTLAEGDQIVAVPTLVRELPAPLVKLIGDLSDTHRVLVGLDLKAATQ